MTFSQRSKWQLTLLKSMFSQNKAILPFFRWHRQVQKNMYRKLKGKEVGTSLGQNNTTAMAGKKSETKAAFYNKDRNRMMQRAWHFPTHLELITSVLVPKMTEITLHITGTCAQSTMTRIFASIVVGSEGWWEGKTAGGKVWTHFVLPWIFREQCLPSARELMWRSKTCVSSLHLSIFQIKESKKKNTKNAAYSRLKVS